MKAISWPLAAICALAALALVPSSAGATCYYSAPGAASFPDSPYDGDLGLAPEIVAVNAATDGACTAAVDPVLVYNFLIDGDSVVIFLDTDGNPATGNVAIGGMDRAVATAETYAGNSGPYLATWNGVEFSLAGAPLLGAVNAGGFAATIDQLGIPASTSIGIQVVTLYEGLYDDYLDFAPEPGAGPFRFPVSFSSTPPPPPPPPAPAQQQQQSTKKKTARRRCRVPRLKGLSVRKAKRKLRRAHCKYRVRGHGRVYSQSPRAGKRTSGRVTARARRRARRSAAADPPRAARAALDEAVRALERASTR